MLGWFSIKTAGSRRQPHVAAVCPALTRSAPVSCRPGTGVWITYKVCTVPRQGSADKHVLRAHTCTVEFKAVAMLRAGWIRSVPVLHLH